MGISWIRHKGTKILYEDYSNLHGDELLDVLYQSEEEFKKLKKPIPVLLNYTGARATQKYMDELKRLGKKYDKLILKSANVGVEGIKKILAKGYLAFTGQGYKVKYFDDMESAKDFLAEKKKLEK